MTRAQHLLRSCHQHANVLTAVIVVIAGHLNTRLQEEIELLSQSFDGATFEPHVTLIPGFEASTQEEAISLAEKVASQLKVRSS